MCLFLIKIFVSSIGGGGSSKATVKSSSAGSVSDDSSPIKAPRLHRGDEADHQEIPYSDGKKERIYR